MRQPLYHYMRRLGINFGIIGVGLSPSDVVMRWFSLQTPMYCIPHPYHMNTKYFSTLIYCEWAYVSTLTLLPLCRRLGIDFRKCGVGLSPEPKWCCIMWWLRLQTPMDCIPYPYHMYTKCFSTLILICCEWAYESTLALLWLCRLGIDFRKIGVGLSPPSDVAM